MAARPRLPVACNQAVFSVSEPLRLDPPVSGPRHSPRLRHVLLACGLLLAALCCWWWLQPPGPTSVRAVVDGMVFPVVSPFSARVEAVFVAEGERVQQGQVLARMDTTEMKERFAAAGRETAALRAPSGPPGMEEMAQRLKAAQEAEQDMTRRLGLARHEEDMKRRVREERVTEHVRAQLHRRSLDNQGGEAAAGKARYTAAREAETRARQNMERAAADFETASRERAALDQELARIRQEMLHDRQMASRSRSAVLTNTGPAAALPALPDGNLRAPADGRILPGMARAGQTVPRDAPLLFLLPEGRDGAESYWVMAYFSPENRDALQAGQACSVLLPDDTVLDGRILEVLENRELPPDMPLPPRSSEKSGAPHAPHTASGQQHVPVRVGLDLGKGPVPLPGTSATCTVRPSFFRNRFF